VAEGLCVLIINERAALEGVFNLPPGVTRVGRALADLALNDPAVSVRHLALRVEGERVEALDLESEGGLWVRITERTALSPTDIFSAGHSLFAARP
jgi:pSer/pThr/pTyr-binding forkhead associated (FHA) protein